MPIEAELKRRDAAFNPVDWKLVPDADNTDTILSDPVKDFGVRTRLDEIKTQLEAIKTNTDGLEINTDGIEAALATLNAAVDTVEGLLIALGANTDGLEAASAAIIAAVDGLEGFVDGLEGALNALNAKDFATQETLIEVRDHLDTVETKLQEIEDRLPDVTLTSRMLAKTPMIGMRLSFDTSSTTFIYTAEALLGADPAVGNNFRGIRIPLDANGNLLGEAEENVAFDWNDRATAPGWS